MPVSLDPISAMSAIGEGSAVEFRARDTEEWYPAVGIGISGDGAPSIGLRLCGQVQYIPVERGDEFRVAGGLQ